MSEEKLNIYQKLAKIRKQVGVLKKNESGYGYTYVSEYEILARITAFMDKYHLSLIPDIVPGSARVVPYSHSKTKFTKTGEAYEDRSNEVLVSADMTWTWINDDVPEERVTVHWTMVGQQSDASQAFGAALTYTSRYFLLKYFNVATTDDDPDVYRTKQKMAKAEEDKMVASEIVKSLDASVREFLRVSPTRSEDVKRFFSQYVKGGDYFRVTDPNLAGMMLMEFGEKFSQIKAKEKEE